MHGDLIPSLTSIVPHFTLYPKFFYIVLILKFFKNFILFSLPYIAQTKVYGINRIVLSCQVYQNMFILTKKLSKYFQYYHFIIPLCLLKIERQNL